MVVLSEPGEYPLEIFAGATFLRQFTWDVSGTPVDLTGCTAAAHIRPKAGSSTLTFSFTTENGGITLTDAANGVFQLLMTDEQSKSLGIRKGQWDLEIYWPSGETTRLLMGDVTVSPNVTIEP